MFYSGNAAQFVFQGREAIAIQYNHLFFIEAEVFALEEVQLHEHDHHAGELRRAAIDRDEDLSARAQRGRDEP